MSSKRKPNLWIRVTAYTRKKCKFKGEVIPIIKKDTPKSKELPEDIQKKGKKLYRTAMKLYEQIKHEDFQNDEDLVKRLDQLYARKRGKGKEEKFTYTIVDEENTTLFNDDDFRS